MKECLAAVDLDTHDAVQRLYDKTIDFGAHPNVAAMAGAFRENQAGDVRRFEILYLTADARAIGGTARSVATGVCSLLIFRNVFRERFDLLDITTTLRQLRQRL